MPLRHLFVIDPLESLNLPLDSSLRMMFALARRGHQIFIAEPWALSWGSGGPPRARCRAVRFDGRADRPVAAEPASLPLDGFRAIHMRKDPPFDMEYVGSTWLLDAVRPDVRVYNDPEALRAINEKATIFLFPDETRPALLSSDPDELLAFIESHASGDAILKPLDLFGGRGVRRLTIGSDDVRRILIEETSSGRHARLVQAFDIGIFEGEVRAFTAFGEPIAWCLKKPATGNYLANTRMGATLHTYVPSPAEEDRVRRVAGKLMERGVALVGFDLIGGWISEANITSPRMLTPGGDEGPLYDRVAALMEDDLARGPRR